MDIKNIETKITKKTKAILYVHLYGYMENIKKVSNLALGDD